jgi:hypothetical protein
LTSISGLGFQFDEDWFKIDVEPGFEHLIVDFPQFDPDIQLEIYDTSLNKIGGFYPPKHDDPGNEDENTIPSDPTSPDGSTSGGGEPMRFNLPSSGTYYIKVSGSNKGTPYDFQYLTICLLEEQTWLSSEYGLGVQGNLDFFFIEITPGFRHLRVDLLFNHIQGNIDMTLYDEWGTKITNSSSMDDNEYIDTAPLNPGIYFLSIHGDDMGNTYNLWWDDVKTDLRPDDNYEMNNNASSAYDLSYDQHKSLWEIDRLGIQKDDDWYKIFVDNNHLRLIVVLRYDSAEGLMGFDIFDNNHTKITGNCTLHDNDYIDYEVPSNGTYYIQVFGDNTGNIYNLWWATVETEPIEMIPGYDLLILLGSIMGVTLIVIKVKRSKIKQ